MISLIDETREKINLVVNKENFVIHVLSYLMHEI